MSRGKDVVICGEDRPLIPDGIYDAECIKYDDSFVFGKARKIFLHFEIIEDGKYHGVRLFQAFNMPYDMLLNGDRNITRHGSWSTAG